MLTPQLNRHASSLLFCHGGPLPSGYGERPGPVLVRSKKTSKRCGVRSIRCAFTEVPSSQAETDAVLAIKAVATVKVTVGGLLGNLGLPRGIDDVKDLLGKTLLLELVSTELDPMNEHRKEMFLEEIKLDASDHNVTATTLTITCKSWVHSKSDNTDKRLFFVNKSYLPAQTPAGLRRLREEELEVIRGDGQGERKAFERIYDYDVYNDLGDPDHDVSKTRPVLGGSKEFPYPRRCRTGRPRSKKDPESETRSSFVYVPRDEAFSEVKSATFSSKTLQLALRAAIPSIQTAIIDAKLGFPHFTAIDSLFGDGLTLPQRQGVGFFRGLLPRLVNAISGGTQELLRFDTPAMIERDKFSWLRDEEFARQTLAGVNPYAIELIKEFPLVSKLDPEVYGPPESAITEEKIEEEIKGVMTVQEAIENKRLFMLDYHDLLLPYVHKVRELEGTTLYGSRTIFFLTNDGTLRPLAIELTIPPSATGPQWKQVFRPCRDATGAWLWRHAKSHVRAHDSCHHELISHWLRTHCCVEPYIIAAHRQLSEMHPIYRLLHPHFRYNMEINALARQALISGGGIIEISFSPLKYSMEISSVAYDQLWRFDMEALPADLIRRGMAVEDPTAEHGLRLTVDDYPFANDGLLIWSAIRQWVEDYVSHYYPDPNYITDDYELQRWWDEVRTEDTATRRTRHASAHHAAVNFGQYDFGGYFPNRPSIARTNMPTEDAQKESFVRFLRKPEVSLLQSLPSQIQAT
ncbi:hypothetical protein MUK42_07613, partial [Musa troglodytarum]